MRTATFKSFYIPQPIQDHNSNKMHLLHEGQLPACGGSLGVEEQRRVAAFTEVGASICSESFAALRHSQVTVAKQRRENTGQVIYTWLQKDFNFLKPSYMKTTEKYKRHRSSHWKIRS